MLKMFASGLVAGSLILSNAGGLTQAPSGSKSPLVAVSSNDPNAVVGDSGLNGFTVGQTLFNGGNGEGAGSNSGSSGSGSKAAPTTDAGAGGPQADVDPNAGKTVKWEEGSDFFEEVDAEPAEEVAAAPASAEPVDPRVLVRSVFRELPVVAAPIGMPRKVGSYAPKNFGMVFYSEANEQTLQADLGGLPVIIKATPVTWTFHYGDGSEPWVSDTPGAPFPQKIITHAFAEEGQFMVHVDTTYEGSFSLDGGQTWQTIDETITRSSEGQPIDVYSYKARLVEPGK